MFIFIRPQRYTFQFTENEASFTICVFEETYRNMLQYCGSKSGREVDKVKKTGLLPVETDLGNIYYQQARLVIECQKIYADFIKEDGFIDPSIIRVILIQKQE